MFGERCATHRFSRPPLCGVGGGVCADDEDAVQRVALQPERLAKRLHVVTAAAEVNPPERRLDGAVHLRTRGLLIQGCALSP